jgi:hypothetical protein
MASGPAFEDPTDGAASVAQILPQDLVPDIARQLEEFGEYRITLDPRSPQRVIDVRWAALGAGRALGRRVRVDTIRSTVIAGDTPITVRVSFAPAHRRSIPRQRHQGG